MAKPRLNQHDKKQCLLIKQLQLIPNLGEIRIDTFRRLVSTTPISSKTQLDLHTFVALPEEVAQSAAAVFDISKGARLLEQIGINLKLNFEF
uniref:Ribosomal protein S16 n=1 Tax=Lemmaphyllum intermedium TaxID=690450 RepID=A0A7M1YBG5_9MONI|nr:ribosomal protein S16 [Lemmaphyllum intermedium]QKV46449.1 ribosomal protein S16 [Lemmaphyllum carnosum var. microphyllum]QOS48951.1 ribosomal protein S16 [Lemmaphyllum intermedium]UWK23904.1 ribosomal protein S16 [Lemmaphyllum carnosum var. drymoglossoides]